ncbi:MAG: HDOD domain-containing protein [Mycobacteriales bacterium]
MTTEAAPQPTELLAELLEDLGRLPPSRGAALRVVQVIDDPSAGAVQVAEAASLDPALTARLLQLANSAYYGLSGRVRTAAFAVTVVGMQTVRSLAVLSAAGVRRGDDVPPGFWRGSAAAAVAAAMVAPGVGVPAPDAFCAGMLHDLGTALLWRRDPVGHGELMARATSARPVEAAEMQVYGGTHATLCADVLLQWHLPEDMCSAIGLHHEWPSRTAPPLRRALQGGLALAALVDGAGHVSEAWARAGLVSCGLPTAQVPGLLARVVEARDQLAGALTV